MRALLVSVGLAVAAALWLGDFWVGVLAGGVRLAVPLGLAALGELIGERAGVLNLGVEGTMAVGAVGGLITGAPAGPWIGMICGTVVGGLLGLLFGIIVVRRGANEIVAGFALALGGTGLAIFVHRLYSTAPQTDTPAPVHVPVLGDIPFLDRLLFDQSPVVWLFPVAFAVVGLALRHTTLGLRLRASGDGPDAARARGVDVARTRTFALVAAGALAGLGGAALTAGTIGQFSDSVVGGRGFVALALVIVARWSPSWLAAATLLIGCAQSFHVRLQAGMGAAVPIELLEALPFLLTLLVLAVGTGRRAAPVALGRLTEESRQVAATATKGTGP